MLHARHHCPLRSGVVGQFIGDHHTRYDALLLEQLPQQTLGCFGVMTALDQDIEHDPMLVDGWPELVLPARDADHDLVLVPFFPGCWKTLADLVGKAVAELQRPLSHRLTTDQDPSGGQHLLHHAQAQWKPEVQPYDVADHLSRKAVAGVTRVTGVLSPSSIALCGHPPVNLTVLRTIGG